MSDTRYLVVDPDGLVTNNIVGFIDLAFCGLIEQGSDLMHVGIGWLYDGDLDDFVRRPDAFVAPVTQESV